MKTIRPLGTQVLVGPLPPVIKSMGGIFYAPHYAELEQKRFLVTAVGPKVRDLSVGDRVLTEAIGANRKPIEDGTGRWIMDQSEILAVIERAPHEEPL